MGIIEAISLQGLLLGHPVGGVCGGIMKVRFGRIAIASGVGMLALFLAMEVGPRSLHHYRVWRADGVWCALGNDEIGWQRTYGEENCPELSDGLRSL